MKQILQSLKDGTTIIEEVPVPALKPRGILARTKVSLVSAGTEKMLVDFGKANLLNKARQQPDKVRMVFDKILTDGVATTLDAVKSKLDQLIPLGYCNVGTVVETGSEARGFSKGMRIVSNGSHSEYVSVPQTLCAAIPDTVSDESAAFTVLAAIGLQGVRLANLTIGESVVVIGTGLIGLLTVQILRAHGCRVLAVDFDSERLAVARRFGAEAVDLSQGEDPLAKANEFSRGRGVDAVLITASSTSNEPVSQAATMLRKRGRIVLVGVTGLELSRDDFYEKELTFQVSCSYGPGRYDPGYEEGGHDYPFGFVRWTEQRNFEAVLDLMATGQLDVEPLISHRFEIGEATRAYELLGSGESSLGILLDYGARAVDTDLQPSDRQVELPTTSRARPEDVEFGAIGAGNFASRILLPAFRQAGARLNTIVSNGGVSGVGTGRKLGFATATTDAGQVFTNEQIRGVIVATRHDSHAEFVERAFEAGKHVYVEKPLCLTMSELQSIEQAANARNDLVLMVGFNRRFSPLVVRMKELLSSTSGPKMMVMTVNAGAIPASHWTQDPNVGGGRIVGEACHFIDLLRFIADSAIVSHSVARLAGTADSPPSPDNVSITLGFSDGSVGTVHYLANGHKAFPKERLDVFVDGRVLQLDNFRRLHVYGWPGARGMRLLKQDKGVAKAVEAFVSSLRTGAERPIPLDEILEVSRVSIEVANAAGDG